MSVVVGYEELGPCRKKVTIEVPATAVTAEIGRVLGDYRRKVRIPGFRRGRVPEKLLRQRFRAEIEQEVAERLVPRYWNQAQAEKNLDPLLPPSFEQVEIAEGEPLTLVASVETRPEIELGDLTDFQLPEDRTEPLDEEVDERLTDLRRQVATWATAERPAASGDLVVAELREVAEGDEAGGEAEKPSRAVRVELGADGGVDEELGLALTGLAAGQGTDYEGVLTGDGRRKYRIEVVEVQERELPELDDELADKVGGFESVDELRRAVALNLRQGRERELRRRREKALLEQLRSRHALELPPGVVQRQAEEILEKTAHDLAKQGVDLEKARIDWGAQLERVRPEAVRLVHDRLLLDAVAKTENIRLDESEFERVLAHAASHQGVSTVELRQQLGQSGRLESLRGQLLREQTVRHLLQEEPPGEAPSNPAGPDGDSAADPKEEG